jgi:stress response protein YsnF
MSKLDEQSEKVSVDRVNNHLEQHDSHIDIQKIIPIKEERFSISKETVVEDVKIQKRQVTKTKKIEVPVLSEEIYVNGRRLRYYDKLLGSELLSKVKDSIFSYPTTDFKESCFETILI